MNKETIISKLKETEYQVRRLRALIHLDDDNVLSTEEDIRKGLHCCFKARNELHSIINELRTGLLGINTKENQEMGLYDDISNPMIKEPEYTDADIKVLNPDYNSAAEVINDW